MIAYIIEIKNSLIFNLVSVTDLSQVAKLNSVYIFTLQDNSMHLHAKVKALAHFTRNCKKCSYCPYTLQLFSQLQRYFQQFFYMSNNFCNRHFSKNLCSFVCSVRGRDVVYTKFGCLPVNNSEVVGRSRWQARWYTRF